MAIGLIVFCVEIVIPRLLIAMGEKDVWWSSVRKLPPEGEMYIIVRGNPDGPFDQILESVPDFELDPHNRFIPTSKITSTAGASTSSKKEIPDYLSRLGLSYVGFNKFLLHKQTHYNKWEKEANSTKWGLVPKDRPGPSIYFQWNMATRIEAAETVGNFPVNAIIVFTVRIVDPVKAYFFAGGWETQTTAAVQGVVRTYIGTKNIDELRAEKDIGGSEDMICAIKAIDLKDYGVLFIDARFVEYDLVAGDKAMSDAVKAREIAELNGKAKVETATQAANARKIRSESKRDAQKTRAEGIEEELKARNSVPNGVGFALAEAVRDTKLQALGGDIFATVNTTTK